MAGTALANRKTRVPVPPAPQGRPTAYKVEYCEIAVSLGKQGKSLAQIAATLNVSKASVYRWIDDHEVFREAMARAKTFEQKWWEDHGQKNLKAKHYQAQMWSRSMAARFPDDYTERKNAGDLGFDLTAFVGALGAAIHGPGASAKVIDAQPVKDDAAAEIPPVEGKHR